MTNEMMNWINHWKLAAETGDPYAIADALSEDAVLISPITEGFVFRGRDQIVELLASVFEVFTEITFTGDIRSDDEVALFASGRVGRLALDEAQHLRLDADGRISEITLLMRPLPAVTAFVRALGPRVARRQGRIGAARTLALAGTFLNTVAATGDRRFLPLARPR